MANVIVYIDVQDGGPAEDSLRTLAFGRRLATERGATLYGFVPCTELPDYADDDMCSVLSKYGADKLILATDKALTGKVRSTVHGVALLGACERYRPAVVMLADGPSANALAPFLAKSTSADLVSHDAAAELPDETPLVVRLLRPPASDPLSTDEAEVIPFRVESDSP